MDLALVVRRLFPIARAHRMTGKGQRHVQSAPIIPAATPLFGARAVSLRRLAVVEIEARVAFERAEVVLVGEDEGRADKTARPVPAAFGLARIEQDKVPAQLRFRVIAIGRVKVTDVPGRPTEGFMA